MTKTLNGIYSNRNIFFSSDFHGYHVNMTKGTSRWDNIEYCRNFATPEEMTSRMVANINSIVGEKDVLIHLGDFCFGGFDNIRKFRNQINCRELHMITGNHDHHIERNKENIQDIFSSVSYEFRGKIGKSKKASKRFHLYHFPLMVWDKHHHGAIHLHGHSHGSLIRKMKKNGGTYYNRKVWDVGIDVHPQFRPYHMDEIITMMTKRDIKNVDHHDRNTN